MTQSFPSGMHGVDTRDKRSMESAFLTFLVTEKGIKAEIMREREREGAGGKEGEKGWGGRDGKREGE